MKKLWIVALTAALSLGAIAFAGKPANPGAGGQCVQAGLATLKAGDGALFEQATKKQLDYSTLADPVNGPIFAELPEGSNLSLGQVVSLHAKSPSLFAWCR
jgi:hypothetical protein